MKSWAVFKTADGWIGVLASEEGISRLTLPQSTAHQAQAMLGGAVAEAVYSSDQFTELGRRLAACLQGSPASFPEKLNLREATPFRRRVWKLTRQIPRGETRSYGWVARKVGRPGAARAVGGALAANPIPIIVPCHRVVGADGKPGGYAGGAAMKKRLLRREADAVRRELPATAP